MKKKIFSNLGKNKKAVSWAIVAISIAVIGAAAYLFFQINVLEFISSFFSGDAPCAMKKSFAFISTLGLGGSAYCPPVYQTITLGKTGDTFVPINIPLSEGEEEHVKKWYKGVDFKDPKWYQAYRMDQAVAESYKSCWRRGKLVPQGKKVSWKLKDIISGRIIYCDLCGVNFLDEDVRKTLGEIVKKTSEKKERELDEYLKKHPVSGMDSKSLWEYTRPKNVKTDFRTVRYPTNEDIAFVYVRMNPNKVIGYPLKVLTILPYYSKEDLPEVLESVVIIPYNEYESLKCET